MSASHTLTFDTSTDSNLDFNIPSQEKTTKIRESPCAKGRLFLNKGNSKHFCFEKKLDTSSKEKFMKKIMFGLIMVFSLSTFAFAEGEATAPNTNTSTTGSAEMHKTDGSVKKYKKPKKTEVGKKKGKSSSEEHSEEHSESHTTE